MRPLVLNNIYTHGQTLNPLTSARFCQEAKVKKIMSKKERREEKKMFSSKDDEHFLLSGVKLAAGRG